MQITLTVSQAAVLEEVAQKSSYVGDKMAKDEGAYDRIPTIDADNPELEQFWDECRTVLVPAVQGMLVSEGLEADGDTYNLVLTVKDNYKTAIQPAMQARLFFFFVYGILGRWFIYTNKDEAAAYAQMSESNLDTILKMSHAQVFIRKMYP